MPEYSFYKDLPIAKKTEYEISKLIEKLYTGKTVEYRNDNKYDFKTIINNKPFTFEVKEDFTCERTGNVGLEYESWARPAGISVSQADYYIYKIHTQNGIKVVLFRTTTLKNMVANKEYFRIVCGGDKGSNSMNYLFKLDVILNNGKVIATA